MNGEALTQATMSIHKYPIFMRDREQLDDIAGNRKGIPPASFSFHFSPFSLGLMVRQDYLVGPRAAAIYAHRNR